MRASAPEMRRIETALPSLRSSRTESGTAVGTGTVQMEPLLRLVPRQCHLQPYSPVTVPTLSITGRFITYASPDSTYAVTRRLIEAADKSILIGIYDFTAEYMKELLLEAAERGVKISLMLDIDGKEERELYNDLVEHGCECVPAPSCASDFAHYFASSHEKVIVIDDRWVLVQSGNYSVNSIPPNEIDGNGSARFHPGNRDAGVAIECPSLAEFFTAVLRSDMKLETDAESITRVLGREAMSSVELLASAPRKKPRLFPCEELIAEQISVSPVLSPDNYMQVLPQVLASAERSIVIEQQYIRVKQPNVQKLLTAIRDNPNRPEVRVILARPLSHGDDLANDLQEIRNLASFGLHIGTNVRILNPDYFVHCHNKMIVIDDERVLISSQNWSDFAVTKNREAGLLMQFGHLAKYYNKIFEYDWETGVTDLDELSETQVFSARSLNAGECLVRLNWGDYVDL